MSSRRSSTRSSRPNLGPTWRSLAGARNPPPTSLSLVFAEPEQGAPLASAVTNLPSSVTSDSASSRGSLRRRPSSLSVDSSAAEEEPQSATAVAGPSTLPAPVIVTTPAPAPPLIDLAKDADLSPFVVSQSVSISPMESQIPFPTQDPERAQRLSSWFGSISSSTATIRPTTKGKGKEQEREMEFGSGSGSRSGDTPNTSVDSTTPSSTSMPSVPIQPPTPLQSSTDGTHSPDPIPIPSHDHPKHSTWFSSSPKLTPRKPGARSPLHSSQTSISSSIDEEVPGLTEVAHPPPTSPPEVVHSDTIGRGRARLASLNPSTSRFTLSIPLLGRPKVPLEEVARQVKDATSSEIPQIQQLDSPYTPASSGPPSEHASDSDLPSSDSSTTSSPTNTEPPPTSSWWSYVGMAPSSASLPRDNSSRPSLDLSQSTVTIKPAAKSASAMVTEHTRSSTVTGTAGPRPPTADVVRKVASVRSVESKGSNWYSPWGWYSGDTPSTASLPANLPPVGEREKTESERVKEEALARPEKSVSALTPVIENLNPIESSISANSSGWASFFSSKALVVKNITNNEVQSDENGMEVMDIDDGLEAVGCAPTPPPPPKSKLPKIRGGKSGSQTPKDADAPIAPPLTNNDTIKRQTVKGAQKSRTASPAPSKASKKGGPPNSPKRPPNLVLPTWSDTFHAPPRSVVPAQPTSKLSKTFKYVSNVLFSAEAPAQTKGKGKAGREFEHYGKDLPRAWDVVGGRLDGEVLEGCKKVVVIGIHGWFPGAVIRTVLGEPTGTSTKFANMMAEAVEQFAESKGGTIEKLTKIPLEGEGTIDRRLDKLYKSLTENKQWMDDLRAADVIFIATHSQGSIVSTHLISNLIRDRHLRTGDNVDVINTMDSFSAAGGNVAPGVRLQKVCCLALCGIHLGPLRYLSSSSVLQPYFQYFESTAARELFEFQDTESAVSKAYVKALTNVLDNGVKMVYIASLDDQVVPLNSGLFASAAHPLILRALYIDGDAYQSSDFLSNLLVLLIRVLNSGLSDSGLLAHLAEATAGSLTGVGHSTAYEELGNYALAVKYLFMTNDGLEKHRSKLLVQPFNANLEQNDYEIPWALRDLIADTHVSHFFSKEISELRDEFKDWNPKTTVLRDIKRKLQPITRLPPSTVSKL